MQDRGVSGDNRAFLNIDQPWGDRMQARSAILKSTVLAALLATSLSAAQAATFAAPTSAVLTLSTDLVELLGASTTFSGIGGATYDLATRTLTEGLASISMTSGSGADLIGVGAAGAGLSLGAGANIINITDLVYTNNSKSLSAVLTVNGVQKYSGAFLTAGTASVTETFNAATGKGLLTTGELNLTDGAATSLLGAFGFTSTFYKNIAMGTNFGNLTLDVTNSVAAVPEPSTYALMGLGLVGIGFAARRRRAA